MKLFLFVLLLQVIHHSKAHCQKATADSLININKIKASNIYDRVYGDKYVFTDDRYIYTVKLVRREIEIYRFDTESNEMNKTPPDPVIASRDINVLSVSKFGENYAILYTKRNNRKDDARVFNSLHYRLIDFETGDISEEVELDRMKVRQLDQYKYCFSEDSSFLMVYYYLENDNNQTSSRKVKCLIYQDNFEIFEQGTVKFPYDRMNESTKFIFVTNYATPYIITKHDETGAHKFLKLKLNKEVVEEKSPKEHAKWGKVYTYLNTKDQVNLVGTYNKGQQLFIQDLNDPENITVIDLPKNVYASIANKNHFRDLLLFSVRPCEDGGMLVIMQEFYKKAVRKYDANLYPNGGGYYNAIVDYFKNRLLIRFDKDRNIKWTANLPQNDPDYSTNFKYQLIDNQHYFFSIKKVIDKGSLSIPPSKHLTEETLYSYTKNKDKKVEILTLCIVDDVSGQYRLVDLFNAEYQAGHAINRIDLDYIMVTNNTISTEFSQESFKNTFILSLPLKK